MYSNPKARIATADELIASMDRWGIDVSVVMNFGWSSQDMCTETNSYIIEAVHKYPGRLVGFCAIQPREGAAALKELERCALAGLRGIGEMRPDDQGFELDDVKVMGPVVEAAQSYKMVFLTHSSEPVGHLYPGKGTLTPDKLYSFITAFPALTVVLAHWGGGLPFYSLMPEVARALKNTYLDCAATSLLYKPDVFQTVGALMGYDKILFASDYPLVAQGRAVTEIRDLVIQEEAKQAILGGNARRLLHLDTGRLAT
ncbi:MAG: hypothetical protein HW403_1421 [Dehalococcoidia bacterium]|nr:hypothetical protein [Dehalococcoidia bacterium]